MSMTPKKKQRSQEDRKRAVIRIVSLTLAGMMIFSMVLAAVLSQLW